MITFILGTANYNFVEERDKKKKKKRERYVSCSFFHKKKIIVILEKFLQKFTKKNTKIL